MKTNKKIRKITIISNIELQYDGYDNNKDNDNYLGRTQESLGVRGREFWVIYDNYNIKNNNKL